MLLHPARALAIAAPLLAAPAAASSVLDGRVHEVYGLNELGREGLYPAGSVGLSLAVTLCNPGDTPIPWRLSEGDSLIEEHPFLGLALFREDSTGVLEMIGKSWIKHGSFTQDGLDCVVAPEDSCQPGGGVTLGVGCSDTYGVGINGSRPFLGPRAEVDPHTGLWTALGSFFDAVPVDGRRDYHGGETSQTAHRLAVVDGDLANPGARYIYEGVAYIADDVDPSNNVGWEECTISWNGSNYVYTDATPASQVANPGPVISTWGDVQEEQAVAADDGTVWLAMSATDQGGGLWRYEYALYNYTSGRGVRALEIPTGSALVSAPGFHDFDQDPSTDWTFTVGADRVRWETDEFAADSTAPFLEYQSMYNFRFVADAPPAPSLALGWIFRPGQGATFVVPTRAPASGFTGAPVAAAREGPLVLHPLDPNPFRGGGRVSFTLDRDATVRLSVLDVRGRTVRVLRDGPARSGRTLVRWDGRVASGARAAGGIYFFRLESSGRARTVKGTLLR